MISSSGPKCPLCGGLMEDGLCLSCGYDKHIDGDLSIGGGNKKDNKKGDSLLDILIEDSNYEEE